MSNSARAAQVAAMDEESWNEYLGIKTDSCIGSLEYIPPDQRELAEKSAEKPEDCDMDAIIARTIGRPFESKGKTAESELSHMGTSVEGSRPSPGETPGSLTPEVSRQPAETTVPSLPTLLPTLKEPSLRPGQPEPVTKETHPDLDWKAKPRMFWVTLELIQSDAYRDLTKIESEVLMFILSKREYREPKDSRDYWNPTSCDEVLVPYKTVKEFFSTGKASPPSTATLTRSIKSLMAHGFIEVLRIGGDTGKGDTSVYALRHNWRIWREGDGPVFTKDGIPKPVPRGFITKSMHV